MGAPLLCSRPECGNVQPCPKHPPRPAWGGSARGSFRERGYSVDHDKHRQELWKDGPPLCAGGCGRTADVLDHIVPLCEGGKDVRENRQPLCDGCHDAKTAQEAQRAKARRRVSA